ncbi:hypothetical protein EVAR_93515_1 [Eumeta japonica]|uniref:Uncharacterized protein n=1 Tax=Eumeta variegata TaxID=151549 RepID=A0A4C1TKC8_EUMVA|nr:hypothetical protein EVAR_93515_1 [Eumeta japonica]
MCGRNFLHEIAPVLISEILNASPHSALECSRSRSIFGGRICDRAAQIYVLCSYQFENVGREPPAIRGRRNLPFAFPDHCPDVVGKSTITGSLSRLFY